MPIVLFLLASLNIILYFTAQVKNLSWYSAVNSGLGCEGPYLGLFIGFCLGQFFGVAFFWAFVACLPLFFLGICFASCCGNKPFSCDLIRDAFKWTFQASVIGPFQVVVIAADFLCLTSSIFWCLSP
jgi:hypothetical protein